MLKKNRRFGPGGHPLHATRGELLEETSCCVLKIGDFSLLLSLCCATDITTTWGELLEQTSCCVLKIGDAKNLEQVPIRGLRSDCTKMV